MNTEDVYNQYDSKLREAQIQADAARLSQQQQEMIIADQSNIMNSINEQLDLSDIMETMHNLLRGYVYKRNEKGVGDWVKPNNNDLIVLSDYGVNYIMQMIQAYLTKNTLLSNYDDKQIAEKMEDFSTTLADAVFMEYDKIFADPTLEECKDEIRRRIQNKVNLREFALQLLPGKTKKINKEKLEEEMLKQMEGRIEKELEIIKEQKRKNKLKRFESIIRIVQDTVHSAYQRAWKGQERTSARSHMHITETKGGMVMPQQNSGFNPLGILKRG